MGYMLRLNLSLGLVRPSVLNAWGPSTVPLRLPLRKMTSLASMAVVFISHATPDDGLASSLSAWMRAEGFGEPFVDHERIVGGS